jgi:hypothetical protein
LVEAFELDHHHHDAQQRTGNQKALAPVHADPRSTRKTPAATQVFLPQRMTADKLGAASKRQQGRR